MALHTIRKGLNLPIEGDPEQRVEEAPSPGKVALVATDYPGMKPTMHVQEGDSVRTGELLFEDKKTPGIRYTAPGTGRVLAVNRGAKRALQSVVIQLDPSDRGDDSIAFSSHSGRHPSALSGDEVRELLVESGMWTALRARPFGKVPALDAQPHSIFVTAVDSNPLAPRVELTIEGHEDDFERGLHALSRLTEGPIFVCTAADSSIQVPAGERFRREEFQGPHPSGTAGLHIHKLDPVNRSKQVWWVGAQDVVAIGRLFDTGRLWLERVVSLAGPSVRRPRLLRTRIGAFLDRLVEGELEPDGKHRVISGSVLSGREAEGEIHGYLGRYDQQISVLPEGDQRELFGWVVPGLNKYSITPTFVSKLIPGKRFHMTTTTNGSPRAIVPIGMYERVMAMDLVPTYLLKSIVVGDIERAEELGVLELVEEDLSLCTFVCPGKIDYAPHLRETLTTIEKEG